MVNAKYWSRFSGFAWSLKNAVLPKPVSASTLNLLLPCLPFLVVIKITPFPALDPYSAVAAASFNTLILSISFGLRPASRLLEFVAPEKSPVFTGTPSIIHKGAEEELMDIVDVEVRVSDQVVLPQDVRVLRDVVDGEKIEGEISAVIQQRPLPRRNIGIQTKYWYGCFVQD